MMSEASRFAQAALSIFENFEGYRTPTLDDYKFVLEAGMVSLDANVLLNLYRYNAQTRTDLLAVLRKIADRLWIPHQTLVEFWRHREGALREPSRISQETDQSLEAELETVLRSIRAWANRVALPERRLDELVGKMKESFSFVREGVRSLSASQFDRSVQVNTNADPILHDLDRLLAGRIGSPPSAEQWKSLKEEGLRRLRDEIPPGYLDKAKPDDRAVGDYLFWEEVVQKSAEQKRDVLIVTGDAKSDWWRKEQNENRGPRLELVDELRRRAGTKLLMLRTESLLLHAKQVLDLEISSESISDAQRVARTITANSQPWTAKAVHLLLSRLQVEANVQYLVLRYAAAHGGFISREKVYELGGYDEGRTLKGFTRPVKRVTQDLRDAGIVSKDAEDALIAEYADGSDSWTQAIGFRVPPSVAHLIQPENAEESGGL